MPCKPKDGFSRSPMRFLRKGCGMDKFYSRVQGEPSVFRGRMPAASVSLLPRFVNLLPRLHNCAKNASARYCYSEVIMDNVKKIFGEIIASIRKEPFSFVAFIILIVIPYSETY